VTQPIRESIWRKPNFRAYLGSTALSGMGLAMQQMLLSWILIGILLLPADEVGLIQAVIGVPGVFLILLGGAIADRADPRNFLIGIYLVAPVFPLFLIAMDYAGWFAVWSVMVWGIGMGFVQSYSMPAQQAILNRISGGQIQQGVTAATIAGFIVQVVGLGLAGQIDRLGIAPVLFVQGLSIGLAAWAMTRVSRVAQEPPRRRESALQGIVQGLRETYRHKVIYNVLVINFISSVFNAGSFMTVFPFVVKRMYDGDAFALSALMAVFFGGAALSNAIMLRFMPLVHPGRVFLLMQLSRIVVLYLIFLHGDWWLLVLGTFGWGLNMGITSNLARTIVQESAAGDFRGRILAVFSVGQVGSAPIGAIILGWLIETIGTLNALLPAMIVSAVLCAYGAWFTGVWRYRSQPQGVGP
jgi:predicted MFS family arabinose efflux permease